jgi:hypothetical protein
MRNAASLAEEQGKEVKEKADRIVRGKERHGKTGGKLHART